jgi:signal recognition particle subunit SRP68
MKGSLAFEQAKHREGLNALSVAHSLLTKLAETAETAHAEALANEVIDEVEPMLRFCAYKLELDTSRGVGELAEETAAEQQDKLVEGYSQLVAGLKEQGKKSKREAVELSWRGAQIPVRSAELVSVVLKVKQALASLEADRSIGADKKKKSVKNDVMGARRMGTYDKALLVLSDAEEVARQLVEDNKVGLIDLEHTL